MSMPTAFRSFVARQVKWALARAGHDVIGRGRYGYDAFLDIERLCHAWQYSIDIFFDVGANDGVTIRHAQHRFRDCRIIAFEPHPRTFFKLQKNMGKAQKVELINVALGSEAADKTMFEYDSSVWNSLLPNAQFAVWLGAEATQIQVPLYYN